MKMIIMVVLALVVLSGGGAGAYFYFKAPAEAATGEGGAEGKPHKKGDPALFVYYEMDPLVLPIVDRDKITQTISLVVALEVADEDTRTLVESYGPKLKDAYLQSLYGMLNKKAAMEGGLIEISSLKKRLNLISNEILGEGVVNDVLLQVVQERPA